MTIFQTCEIIRTSAARLWVSREDRVAVYWGNVVVVYTFSNASTEAAVNFNLDLYAAKSNGAVGLMCLPALV